MDSRAKLAAQIKKAKQATGGEVRSGYASEAIAPSRDRQCMPEWPPGFRMMPIEHITRGVFGAPRASAELEAVRRRPHVGDDGRIARYTGFLLGQVHADILMAILETARGVAVGEVIPVDARRLERILGGHGGAANVEALDDHLAMLAATCVQIGEQGSRAWFGGSLLPWMRREDGSLHLRVDAELCDFVLQGYKRVDVAARKRLARKPLAQWMQLRLIDERRDWLELEGLRCLSRAAAEGREFRRKAGAACEALDEAAAGVGRWHVGGGAGELLLRAA